MINLIPPHARRRVGQEYWLRTVTVWLFLLSIAFVCIAILFIPTYILVQNQLSVYSVAFQSAAADNEQFSESKTAITNANVTARLLAAEDAEQFSKIVRDIDQTVSAAIVLTNIALDRKEGEIAPIRVAGVATDRVSLAAFRDALEAQEQFAAADLPLSSLAKDADIPFTITITPEPGI